MTKLLTRLYYFGLFAGFILYSSCNSLETSDGLDQLVKGFIAYNIPDTMEVPKSYRATVSITKSENDSVLYQNLNRANFYESDVRISSRVRVVLLDPEKNKNFEISPLNTEEQLVDDSTNTIWEWNVKPLRSGNHELILRATIRLLDDKRRNPFGPDYRDIPVFEKNIKVQASTIFTIKQFIGDYWQWLTTVIVIPLLIWSYNNFKERKKVKKVPPKRRKN